MRRVTVVGAGYVGLTTGVVLAYLGHRVTVVDVDKAKVEGLKAGRLPFFEPHLKELVGLAQDRLAFTHRYEEAIPGAEVVFLAVGTPAGSDGSPDLSQVRAAAEGIGRHLGPGFTVVVNNFIAAGGDGFTVLKEAQGYRVDTGFSDAESFMDYLRELKEVEAGLEGRIEVLNEPKGERPAYWPFAVPVTV